jgi:hypothetical protein
MGVDLLRLHSDKNGLVDCTPCAWSFGVLQTFRRGCLAFATILAWYMRALSRYFYATVLYHHLFAGGFCTIVYVYRMSWHMPVK